MNKFLQKKLENKDNKPSAPGFDARKNNGKDSKGNKDAWSDEEDDYKVDIKIAEKKVDDSKKPAVVNITSAAWKEYEAETKPVEAVKETKRWGDGLSQGVKIEKEAFPTIEEALANGNPKKNKYDAPPATTLTRGSNTLASTAIDTSDGNEGRIKFKSSKPTNSLLSGVLATNNPAPQAAPAQQPAPTIISAVREAPDSGSDGGVIKFKNKLKVEYKETSVERRQREALEEIRKIEEEKKKAEAATRIEKPEKAEKKFETRGFENRGFAGTGEKKETKETKEAPKLTGRGQLIAGNGFNDDKRKGKYMQEEDGWITVAKQ